MKAILLMTLLFIGHAFGEIWEKPAYTPDENHLPLEEIQKEEARREQKQQEKKVEKKDKKEQKENVKKTVSPEDP